MQVKENKTFEQTQALKIDSFCKAVYNGTTLERFFSFLHSSVFAQRHSAFPMLINKIWHWATTVKDPVWVYKGTALLWLVMKGFLLFDLQFDALGFTPSSARSLLPPSANCLFREHLAGCWLQSSWWLFLTLTDSQDAAGSCLMPFPAWCWPLETLSTCCPLPWTPWASLPFPADNSCVDTFEFCWSSSRHCALLSLSRLFPVSSRVLGAWCCIPCAPHTSWGLTRREGKERPGLQYRGAGVPWHTTSSKQHSLVCAIGLEHFSRGLGDLFWALSGSVAAEGHTEALMGLCLMQDFTVLVRGSFTVTSGLQEVDWASSCINFSFCLWASLTSSDSSSGASVRGRLTWWFLTSLSKWGLGELRSKSNCALPSWVAEQALRRPTTSFSCVTDRWWPGVFEVRPFLAASLRFWPFRCNMVFLTGMVNISSRWWAA